MCLFRHGNGTSSRRAGTASHQQVRGSGGHASHLVTSGCCVMFWGDCHVNGCNKGCTGSPTHDNRAGCYRRARVSGWGGAPAPSRRFVGKSLQHFTVPYIVSSVGPTLIAARANGTGSPRVFRVRPGQTAHQVTGRASRRAIQCSRLRLVKTSGPATG